MNLFDRRDFLLSVVPLVGVSGLILGSVDEVEAQVRRLAINAPAANTQVTVGQTVVVSLGLIRTLYPRITRINFKANGQLIGSTTTRPHQINSTPTQSGTITLTAEATLSNGSTIASPSVNVVAAASQLEVLYDTLGSATDGWGWAGQGGYTSTFTEAIGTNYIVVTSFIGSISATKRIRRIEVAGGARNTARSESLPVSYFDNHTLLGIWNSNVLSFWDSPIYGSLAGIQMPIPNLGSTTAPLIPTPPGAGGTYVFGWDNLNILLPPNVPIELSLQFEGIQLGDASSVKGSNLPGPFMRGASTSTGNYNIAQPMAIKITVSN